MNSDFDVEIGTGAEQGSYQVRVVHSGAGVESLGTLTLDVGGLARRRDELEARVLSSAVRARRASATELPVRQVGEQLFKALFTGEVLGAYRASLSLAQKDAKQLRVVLRLAAPELAALPWEMLFDPETERYLCKSEPLVRHVPAPYTPGPLETRLPLKILGLVASPRNLQPLDVEAEKRHLNEALAEPIAAGRVKLEWLPKATWTAVHDRLLAESWHALHFIGHGDFDAAREEGVLALVGEDGLADMVSANQLADLLTQARPPLQLVVLNSCSSGEAGAHDLFSGTAAALAHSGITAVAAMQFAVSDKAAIAFARGFYTALTRGRNVDEAVCSGRISIGGTRDTLEWVTPVLYLRGGATQVFAITDPEPVPPPHVPDRGRVKIRAKAEHRALYVEASAESQVGNYETALGLLDDLLSLDPQYPDAARLRDAVRHSKQLADTYRAAKKAEDAEKWEAPASAHAEIFVSYAREDEARVSLLCRALEGRGWSLFWDRRIPAGKSWREYIGSALDCARCIIVVWSVHSVESKFVLKEAEEADRRNILVPVLLDDVRPPFGFRDINATNLRGWSPSVASESFDQLLTDISTLIAGASAPPSPRPRKPEAAWLEKSEPVQKRIDDLLVELRSRADAEQWQAVLDVDAEISRLDSSSSDPDGLATQARQELAAKPLGRPEAAEVGPIPGQPFQEETTNMSFLWVPPGKFWMGSSKTRGERNYGEEAWNDELPAREVTLTKGFWIGEHPVTNAQYSLFVKSTGARSPEYLEKSRFNAPEKPVVGVDWEESRKFVEWLTTQSNLGEGLRFDLPTEAEWEYAARGTDGRKYPWGGEAPGPDRADFGGWWRGPAAIGVYPTGRSPWGVQDIAGGVWEWCLDGWQDSYATMVTNLVNSFQPPASGASRVVRGGSWRDDPRRLRCATRRGIAPGKRDDDLGFRVVCRRSRQP